MSTNSPDPPSTGSAAELARELDRLSHEDPEALARRAAGLSVRQQAELCLRLPPAQRLEMLLHAPQPMRLVRALPDGELYSLVREIGPTDALPLLHLASASQIHHVLDLESWRGDRFDAERSGAWLALLAEAGEPVIRRFLQSVDEELLTLLYRQWLHVESIVSDEDPNQHGTGHTEHGDERGLVSPDGYYRLRPRVAAHGPAALAIARLHYQMEPKRYLQVLWDAMHHLPAELEEHALRWRESRLEEHGYPPWNEALHVYAPPLQRHVPPQAPSPPDADSLVAVRAPLRILSGPLIRTLEGLGEEPRERLLFELVSLGNALMVADGADTGDPEAHRGALVKGAGLISAALEARDASDPAAVRTVIEQVPLVELFREGYARIASLQHRVTARIVNGWAASAPQSLDLLDAPLRERVGALLEPRPAYFQLGDEDRPARIRPFHGLAEIDETAVAVELAELLGTLFVTRMGLDPARAMAAEGNPPHFSTFFITLLAWHTTRDELRADPLSPKVVSDFLRQVASRKTAAPDAPGRALAALLPRLASEFELAQRERFLLHGFGRACLEQLASECGTLDPSIPPDRRFVHCLLLDE